MVSFIAIGGRDKIFLFSYGGIAKNNWEALFYMSDTVP